ncbi:DUF1778 domain-containing protein [Arenibacter sp. M-2]|uniref:type II toxin-antitoxin system TacA family antitoxin n=1 Tax=Arenibacter sp. M-2 TaxID=3053612 RepID=UPI00256FE2DE|nr:DUF1778 domain-containing protein [Arenibacter sp. M-2]MDL5511067.1 DUF1778 domain-containing protein [Arenibacter sp. M-2]|tara:strand:+ start:8640 stop:8951 length:312 start_codon:yes stop_codon:yes gene_type:complete
MKSKIARFDTRWTTEQKEMFEHASSIGGFRSLSEFVFFAVQQRAEEIIEKHEQIISSRRDQEIFANALLNPPSPNSKLKRAAKRYMELIESDGVRNKAVKVKS